MIGVRAIDLRERHQASPGALTTPGFLIPPHADWICSMCRIGEHDSCAGEIKVCFCPVCWGNEDDNQTEDRLFDGNLTSTGLLW